MKLMFMNKNSSNLHSLFFKVLNNKLNACNKNYSLVLSHFLKINCSIIKKCID